MNGVSNEGIDLVNALRKLFHESESFVTDRNRNVNNEMLHPFRAVIHTTHPYIEIQIALSTIKRPFPFRDVYAHFIITACRHDADTVPVMCVYNFVFHYLIIITNIHITCFITAKKRFGSGCSFLSRQSLLSKLIQISRMFE